MLARSPRSRVGTGARRVSCQPRRPRRPTGPASARCRRPARSLITLQTRLRYTTMVAPPGRRGDPRRHLWRQGLLGHHGDAQHRAREARERGRRHEPEPRDGQRRRLLVPAHREGRRRHARPQGVRERRSERAAGQAEVLQRGAGRRAAEPNWRKPRLRREAANRRTTEALAAYQQEYPGKLQFVYGRTEVRRSRSSFGRFGTMASSRTSRRTRQSCRRSTNSRTASPRF